MKNRFFTCMQFIENFSFFLLFVSLEKFSNLICLMENVTDFFLMFCTAFEAKNAAHVLWQGFSARKARQHNMCGPKGSSTNDVTQYLTIFDPSSPSSHLLLRRTVVTKFLNPSPLSQWRHLWKTPNTNQNKINNNSSTFTNFWYVFLWSEKDQISSEL